MRKNETFFVIISKLFYIVYFYLIKIQFQQAQNHVFAAVFTPLGPEPQSSALQGLKMYRAFGSTL